MIASTLGAFLKKAVDGPGTDVAQMVHEFLKSHCAVCGEAGRNGDVNDGLAECRDGRESVEALVCVQGS